MVSEIQNIADISVNEARGGEGSNGEMNLVFLHFLVFTNILPTEIAVEH